jgi:hypothetical protein
MFSPLNTPSNPISSKLGECMSEYYLAGPGEALATIAFFGLNRQAIAHERLLSSARKASAWPRLRF